MAMGINRSACGEGVMFSIGDLIRLNKPNYKANYGDMEIPYGVVSYVNPANKGAYIGICWLNLENMNEDNQATYNPKYFEKVS